MTICKGYILYDANYMTFCKKQTYSDRKNISGGQRFGGRAGGMNRWGAGDF